MQREDHVLGESFAYHYPGPNADHAMLILHGLGGHGGIYDSFCGWHAAQGVDVWSMDGPGHGRSRMTRPPGRFTVAEWVDAAVAYGQHIKDTTGLPVFINGSSFGVTSAYPALHAGPFVGAILMGFFLPGSPLVPPHNPFRTEAYEQIQSSLVGPALQLNIERLGDFDKDYGYKGAHEQKHADPLNTWTYDLASWASAFRYDPPVRIEDNDKPILFTVGENDVQFPLSLGQPVIDATAGPVQVHVEKGAGHQLMLTSTTRYSEVLLRWCRSQLSVVGEPVVNRRR